MSASDIEKYSLENLRNFNPSKVDNFQDEDDSFLSNLDFIKFLIVARKNLPWLILILSFTLAAAYIYNRYTKAIYESSSVIKLDIKRESSKLLGIAGATNDLDQSVLSGEIELLRSNLIYDLALKIIDLKISYYAKGNITYEERYKNAPFEAVCTIVDPSFYNTNFYVEILNKDQYVLTYSIGGETFTKKLSFFEQFKTNGFELTLKSKFNSKDEISTSDFFFRVNSQDFLMGLLANNITIEILNQGANTIRISFKDFNPSKAKDIVAAIDSVYTIESLQRKYKAQEQSLDFLEHQLADVEEKLSEMESKLEQFALQNKTFNVKETFGKSISRIEDLEKENFKIRTEIEFLNKAKETIDLDKPLSNLIPLLNKSSNSQLQTLSNSIEKIQAERDKLSRMVQEGTLVYSSKNNEYTNLKNSFYDQILEQKKALYEQLIANNEYIHQFEYEFLGIPSKDTKLTRIKRYYNMYERYYILLMDKRAEYGMAKAGMVPEFLILSQPSLAKAPIFPKKFNVYLTGFAVGLVLCFILVVIQYFLHNTINNIGELQKLVIAPILGYVPYYSSEKMTVSKLVIDKSPKSPLSESLRAIRTNLDFMVGTHKSKRIISVTSTVSGEGKTFIAINLAGVIAISGTKTVLIDMDMRKPKVNLAFDVDNEKGMSTILIGKHSIEECIHKTPIPDLDVITSGPIPPNPSELILRPEMDAFFEELHKIYQIILIDTPPVGMVTDGTLLMRKADLPIYVVRAEYSKKGYEKNINELQRKYKYHNLSVILNGFKTIKGYGYGYKYGYYGKSYGYYEKEKNKKEPFFKKLFNFGKSRLT